MMISMGLAHHGAGLLWVDAVHLHIGRNGARAEADVEAPNRFFSVIPSALPMKISG